MMDPVTKEFTQIDDPKDAPAGHTVFTIGAKVDVGGVEFRIRKITKKDLVLRPVK